jgi:signal transduction histidine kinase
VSSTEDRAHRRDRVLATYRVLDGPPRRELTALVDLAAQLSGAPFAAINLLTSRSQHQVATSGFAGEVTPLDDAMCRVVVESGEPVLLEDASRAPRFAENPWTTGEIAHVRSYGSHPLRTPAGVVIGTLCVFDNNTHRVTHEAARGLAQLADRVVDVLELELASRRLGEANERLSASHERLVHFAGQVSHDLKNPLTSVSLSLESLELDVTDPDHVDSVARARRGVDRMNDLINTLHDFASQGSSPGEDLVDLAAGLELALEDLDGRVARGSVTAGWLPVARGDAAQLRSVLMSLVDNAVKFTDGQTPEIEVDATPLDGRNRIEVRDRGRGVPVDKRERIFAPFARLDKSVEGAGIGLANCRRIVEAHGGSMGVDEREGGGSVFWFELPAVDDTVDQPG